MLGPSEFRELVSGRRRGPVSAIARAALRVLEVPYTAAVRLRNFRYDSVRAEVIRVPVPVISVGNLTLGGTGKTPTVEWLARWFSQRNVRVGLVSRGYGVKQDGSKQGHANDEALELAQKLPDVPHVLDPDRVRGARQAIEQFGCQLVLLDDGFQHRRIARDLDIVLVDALEPFGFGHVFPRGTLREPLAGWSRAQVIVLTRAELATDDQRASIRQQVRKYAPTAIWVEATHAPKWLQSPTGQQQPLERLAGKPIAAFCGIGNPAGFRHALVQCGYKLIAMREFADHFNYAAEHAAELARWADSLHVAAVVCTAKDLVKIGPLWSADKPLVALSGQLELLTGGKELETALAILADRAKSGG